MLHLPCSCLGEQRLLFSPLFCSRRNLEVLFLGHWAWQELLKCCCGRIALCSFYFLMSMLTICVRCHLLARLSFFVYCNAVSPMGLPPRLCLSFSFIRSP